MDDRELIEDARNGDFRGGDQRLEALASRPAVAEGAIGWIDQATLDQLLSAPKDQRTRIHVVGVGLVKVGEAGALIYAAPKP